MTKKQVDALIEKYIGIVRECQDEIDKMDCIIKSEPDNREAREYRQYCKSKKMTLLRVIIDDLAGHKPAKFGTRLLQLLGE